MSIDVRELLDDESLDPKKLFNEEEYSTLIIKRDGFNKSENNLADLVEGLLDENKTRAELEEIFSALKKANASEMLIASIKEAQKNSEKALLISACWECGLDFTQHFLFFTELSCSNDFNVALEALTVIESIEGMVDEDTLTKALVYAQNNKSKNQDLMADLIGNIKDRIS